MFRWLKKLLSKPRFKEVLWVASGGDIVIRYEGNGSFVKGDWSDFEKIAARSDLVFYHTHPPRSTELSQTDRRNMESVRMALAHDYIFVLVTEDRDGNRVEKMYRVSYSPKDRKVSIIAGISPQDFAQINSDVIRNAWKASTKV